MQSVSSLWTKSGCLPFLCVGGVKYLKANREDFAEFAKTTCGLRFVA